MIQKDYCGGLQLGGDGSEACQIFAKSMKNFNEMWLRGRDLNPYTYRARTFQIF
jgi:hypothetical protein